MRTLRQMEKLANMLGLSIATTNPGDGRRYRVFAGPGLADFHQGGGLYTALHLRELEAFLLGYMCRVGRENEEEEV